ncbi:MAG: tRNA (guanine-N7)-methyltransferase [Planctomycetales bacterium]|nr:tRNA (guanine-N7)-methyltransferase [Planctomycetales bacterium]
MGRRSLRKVSPELDWAPYLLKVEDLPRPWSRAAVFGSPVDENGEIVAIDDADVPLEVELGSGKGLFMQRASGERPDHHFLGLEVSYKYARYSASRLAKHERTNARMVHGDGLAVFREILPDRSVTAIHVYFPDPWWKARHRRRRVLNESFLVDAQRTLISGGLLHVWTDVEEYFESTLELIRDTKLEGPLEVPERPAADDMDFRTHFERRTRLHDEPVYRAQFRNP